MPGLRNQISGKSFKFVALLFEKLTSKMSPKFCNILVRWVTFYKLLMFLLRSWRRQTTLDCKMPSSSATCQIYFYGLEHSPRIHSCRPTRPCQIVKVLATQVKFLETSVYCTVASPFAQQMFLVVSMVL